MRITIRQTNSLVTPQYLRGSICYWLRWVATASLRLYCSFPCFGFWGWGNKKRSGTGHGIGRKPCWPSPLTEHVKCVIKGKYGCQSVIILEITLLGIRMSWLFTQVLAPTSAAMMVIFITEQIYSEILFQTPLKALEKYCLRHRLCSCQLGTYDVGITFVLVSELMQTKITIWRGVPGAWTGAQVHIFSPDPNPPCDRTAREWVPEL